MSIWDELERGYDYHWTDVEAAIARGRLLEQVLAAAVEVDRLAAVPCDEVLENLHEALVAIGAVK